jgi:hypothetical protein
MDPIEADQSPDDSAYGDEISSYTASLTASALNFPEKDGRRYHRYKEGKYFLPNDDKENSRLDILHELGLVILKGKLNLAPIENDIERAIDLGTGTGLWAVEFADEHEKTEVIGSDLSPIQPSWVPRNVKFIVDDIEEDWQQNAKPFDFIHSRHLAGSIRDWPRLVRQAFANTKPGGYLEMHDLDLAIYSQDGTLASDSPLKRWNDQVLTGLRTIGANPCPGPELEGWMKAAGFVNVQVLRQTVPAGPWPKDKALKQMGILNYLQIMEGLEGISLGTLRLADANLTVEQIQAFLVEVRNDLHNPKIHAIYDL